MTFASFKIILVVLGVLANGVGTLFYIKKLFAGHAKPNKMTFLMWSIAPLIGGTAAVVKGVRWAAVPVFAVGLWPLAVLIAAFSVRSAYWELTGIDYVCGFFSVAALILWAVTREPDIAILFAILSDGFATVPTLIKAWRHPDTEYLPSYFASSFSGLTGVIAAPAIVFSEVAFPAYLFIMMGIIGLAVVRTNTQNL